MKKLLVVLSILGALTTFGGCGKREVVEVSSNEVAYSVNALANSSEKEGGDKSQKFGPNSREAWNKIKSTSKVIVVPYQKISTGVMPFDFIRIPQQKIVVVNISPVSKEWTAESNRGTSTTDESFIVATQDSAKFSFGLTMSARIIDSDTYLAQYGVEPTSDIRDAKVKGFDFNKVVDGEIRRFVTGELNREFKTVPTKELSTKTNDVIERVANTVKERYAKSGIEIISFNMAGAPRFVNDEIQRALDDTAKQIANKQLEEANMEVNKAKEKSLREVAILTNEKLVAEAERKKNVAIKDAEATRETTLVKVATIDKERQLLELEKMKVELQVKLLEAQTKNLEAQRWNGKLPYADVTTSGASSVVDTNGKTMMFNLK